MGLLIVQSCWPMCNLNSTGLGSVAVAMESPGGHENEAGVLYVLSFIPGAKM
jgi:hypothetical protein